MINEETAYSIALEVRARSGDDPDQPWHLEEFAHGWIVRETPRDGGDRVGSTGRVIEKESGRVLRFPSYVPTSRIFRDYASVVDKAHVVRQ